jgi:hypothetical protein
MGAPKGPTNVPKSSCFGEKNIEVKPRKRGHKTRPPLVLYVAVLVCCWLLLLLAKVVVWCGHKLGGANSPSVKDETVSTTKTRGYIPCIAGVQQQDSCCLRRGVGVGPDTCCAAIP